MKTQLLASSPDVAGIEKMVNRYYFSEGYRVDPDTLAISNINQNHEVPADVRVIRKNDRYRFERIID